MMESVFWMQTFHNLPLVIEIDKQAQISVEASNRLEKQFYL